MSLRRRIERLEAMIPAQEKAGAGYRSLNLDSDNKMRLVDWVQIIDDFRQAAIERGWLEQIEPNRYRITAEGKKQRGHDLSLLSFLGGWHLFGPQLMEARAKQEEEAASGRT